MRENGEAQFLTNQMWEEEIQKTKTKKKKTIGAQPRKSWSPISKKPNVKG
jgi:hypothetical protein